MIVSDDGIAYVKIGTVSRRYAGFVGAETAAPPRPIPGDNAVEHINLSVRAAKSAAMTLGVVVHEHAVDHLLYASLEEFRIEQVISLVVVRVEPASIIGMRAPFPGAENAVVDEGAVSNGEIAESVYPPSFGVLPVVGGIHGTVCVKQTVLDADRRDAQKAKSAHSVHASAFPARRGGTVPGEGTMRNHRALIADHPAAAAGCVGNELATNDGA